MSPERKSRRACEVSEQCQSAWNGLFWCQMDSVEKGPECSWSDETCLIDACCDNYKAAF